MDRDVGDTFEVRHLALRHGDRDARSIRELRGDIGVLPGHAGAHVLDCREVESRQTQQRPQHAQDLPCRTGFAERLHDAVEALNAAFAVDERAGGFGERADGQEHARVIGTVTEWREHRDELGLVQRGARCDRIGAIEFGLRVEHDVGPARILEHRPGVEATRLRQHAGDVAADAVRGFGQAAQRGAGDAGERLREGEELRRIGMLFGEVAEQDRLALARGEACGDGLRAIRGLDAGQRRRHGLPRATGGGDDDLGQRGWERAMAR